MRPAPANRPIDLDELLTVPEASKLLNVSARSLWAWISSGRLPAARLSRRATRIKKSDLVAFVESRMTAAG